MVIVIGNCVCTVYIGKEFILCLIYFSSPPCGPSAVLHPEHSKCVWRCVPDINVWVRISGERSAWSVTLSGTAKFFIFISSKRLLSCDCKKECFSATLQMKVNRVNELNRLKTSIVCDTVWSVFLLSHCFMIIMVVCLSLFCACLPFFSLDVISLVLQYIHHICFLNIWLCLTSSADLPALPSLPLRYFSFYLFIFIILYMHLQ